MPKKYGLIIDITRCDGCGSCMLSVKDEYSGNSYPGYCAEVPDEVFLMNLKEVTQGSGYKLNMDYIPRMFPHDRNFDVSKIPGAPEGSIYVREDGLLVIDPEKAKGCRAIYDYLKEKCPDDNLVYWNEELQIPQIYTLDSHRLDEGEKYPRCVEDCPTQAMHWGDLNDPESDVSRFLAEHEGEIEDLYEDEGADYVVRYYKLPKPFIAGEVTNEDESECIPEKKVTLTEKSTGNITITETDFMGDFWFKYLKKDESYTVEVEGCEPFDVVLDEAKNVGVVAIPEKDSVKEKEFIKAKKENSDVR